jgi:DNA-binding LacI/PurR family transcriptional regulator
MHERRIRVPEDVSVTGFDNIGLAEFVSPALTTAHIPREEIGHLIGEALIPGPRGRGEGREIRIETALVVRESTAPASTRSTRSRAASTGQRAKKAS